MMPALSRHGRSFLLRLLLSLLPAVAGVSCRAQPEVASPPPRRDAAPAAQPRAPRPPMPWDDGKPLEPGEVFALRPDGPRRETSASARAAGLLIVDLSDEWAPFIFSDGEADAAKPNGYRATFIALANDRASPDEVFLESPAGIAAVRDTVPPEQRSHKAKVLSADETRALERVRRAMKAQRAPNHLEVYGIPPTLSVLWKRIEDDTARDCYDSWDKDGVRAFSGEVSYQSRDQVRKEHTEALNDAAWIADKLAALRPDAASADAGTIATLEADPKLKARVERYRRGQARLRVVRAVQARLSCEGLLSAKPKVTPGLYELSSHEALAEFEKKNDIFGWGIIAGDTQEALLRAPAELHLDTFRRIAAERLADAAGILEDGSMSKGKKPASYRDASGAERPVPNLIGDHVDALLKAMHIESPDDLVQVLRAVGRDRFANLRIAIPPLPLPEYYAPVMDLVAEIDRGDIWYDLPFDKDGKPLTQRREKYPSLTVSVNWRRQKIPLVRWRTTIGSWRSELHSDGQVYLKYKNSDVGPRIWKHVVAAPVWIPPDGTPGKDLLTKKVFDRNQKPVTVVDTQVMGPGFESAYGLVMAIHIRKDGFDNQIRTHGSVDYTSIARRFSHGCHRLVNNRAVRLFDFVLRHRTFQRLGENTLAHFKKKITQEGQEYEYELATRGYYYELVPPMPVNVLEGRIMGQVKKPPLEFVRKPGVDYSAAPADSVIEAAPQVGP